MPRSPAATLVPRWPYVHQFPDEHNCHMTDPTSHVYPRGSYVRRGTDEHMDFFKKNSCFVYLPGQGASKTGIQYTNSSKHIYNIKQSNMSNITSIDPTPPQHIKIQTLQVLECTARHSVGSLCSTPPPLVLSTVWANASPSEASYCESETSKT
jgi:hypothetical protein